MDMAILRLVGCACVVLGLVGTRGEAADGVDFTRDIRTILSNNCFQCHGPDEAERKGGKNGLRLDTAEGALADQGGSAAIVPGKPDESTLIERITSDDPELRMPPPKTGKSLSAREIELLKTWVGEGAKFAQHWAYIRPVRPAVPEVQHAGWAKTAIDQFLLARMEREGLSPSAEADRNTLIRRVSMDLTGLPPTPQEVNEFLQDSNPGAYERLVDRLLSRSSYGEHWARDWLDLARYADSAGYADDPPREIWLYRDWVIRALNSNMPYDQFTIEQLAGDLLPNPTDDQRIATAFHRNTQTNNEGGTNDEEYRSVAVVDRVNTTFAVWMGTTMACAQCHSHKYDPISQEEYFRFYAFFNNTQDADRGDEFPRYAVMTDEQREQKARWEAELAALNATLSTMTPELRASLTGWETPLREAVAWTVATPRSAVGTEATTSSTVGEDGAVTFSGTAANETYTLEIPVSGGTLAGLRLEALADERLPGKGPGLSDGGNFVLTGVRATVVLPEAEKPRGRFVRVELPRPKSHLMLAEVQVFHGDKNVALEGDASQRGTAYDGPAKLAIDGNTNGDYFAAKSTTHTELVDNPFWEVDLKQLREIDRIVVWNRTDGGVQNRLAGYKVLLLDDARKVVWERSPEGVPNPSQELAPNGDRELVFAGAAADFSQAAFDPQSVLSTAKPGVNSGWAVGGKIGADHELTLWTAENVELPANSVLRVRLEQQSPHAKHLLGKVRLSLTDRALVREVARVPAAVLAAIRVPVEKRDDGQRKLIDEHFLRNVAEELATERKRLAQVTSDLAGIKPPSVPVMMELAESSRRKTQIQHRGNFLDLGAEVTEGVPAVFPPLPADAPKNRLTVARWLMDPANPLTARVAVNRYWEKLFGIGIVVTSEEYGSQGDLPTHPELLDWLAVEFVQPTPGLLDGEPRPWDVKRLLKLMVTSAAYRQSARVTPELLEKDPENRLLARGPRFRMTAETIRDQALFVSGLLSPKMYGPPVKPPQPNLGVSAAFGSGIDWQTSGGEDRYRRGIYTTWRRSNPYPSMQTFDAPNREVCTVRRPRTNTPLQALVTLNDPVYIEAAQALARRMIAEGGSDVRGRLQQGFLLCLARPASDAELSRMESLWVKCRERFAADPGRAKAMATEPIGPPPEGVDTVELAAWSVVASVLLNLDEMFMTR